jgi:hypothetical protein
LSVSRSETPGGCIGWSSRTTPRCESRDSLCLLPPIASPSGCRTCASYCSLLLGGRWCHGAGIMPAACQPSECGGPHGPRHLGILVGGPALWSELLPHQHLNDPRGWLLADPFTWVPNRLTAARQAPHPCAAEARDRVAFLASVQPSLAQVAKVFVMRSTVALIPTSSQRIGCPRPNIARTTPRRQQINMLGHSGIGVVYENRMAALAGNSLPTRYCTVVQRE